MQYPAIVGIYISLVVCDVMFCPKYQTINSVSDVVKIFSMMASFFRVLWPQRYTFQVLVRKEAFFGVHKNIILLSEIQPTFYS